MESGSKSGGAAAAAGGRLLVDESSSDVQNDRKRFQIELKPGETTIVSWVKLLKESGIPVDQSPPPSPEPPKWFHEEDEPRREYSNIILKKEKEEQNYRSSTIEHCQPKKQRTDTSQVLERVNVVQLTKNTKMGHARVKSSTDVNYHYDKKNKSGSPCGMTSDWAAVCVDLSEEHSVNNGRNELPDLNVPYTMQTTSTSSRDIKDESCGLMNGSMLESTILEMETMVAESRQLHGDVQDSVHSVASKSHLPPELKKKLETVARLAHSSQGRISDELMMRLMSILGHWLKPRTLKRCLRDIVSSSTCGLDDIRFIQIKKEVVEMIKLRVPSMETKVAHNAKYSMDHEMEDKICDFYDIYVQAMDEIKNSEIRKFYIQLAALWPKGSMDNHGIRNAICRAKERRRTLLQEKGHEKKPTAGVDNNLHEEANLVAEQGKTVNDHNAPVVNFPDTVVPGTPELDRKLGAPAKRFSPPSAGDC
ncbi:ubinuclein-2 isoform X1 [Lactuca sativa]|uniref:ubinuclein-2 isoform X1 n=1 Tax=Lactuca sativa TaxID=4236 RepID=UPI000CB8383D|nr:ubinuclein-2 isoform X1 [Lactuca sativa]